MALTNPYGSKHSNNKKTQSNQRKAQGLLIEAANANNETKNAKDRTLKLKRPKHTKLPKVRIADKRKIVKRNKAAVEQKYFKGQIKENKQNTRKKIRKKRNENFSKERKYLLQKYRTK
jgi:hypothetical protein